jgi:GntR family transcriptional regulator
MREEGVVESRQGRKGGTFLLDSGPYWQRYGRMDIHDRADLMVDKVSGAIWSPSEKSLQQNHTVETRVLSAVLESCPLEICELFSLTDSQALFRIVRARTADGEPMSYEQTYIDPQRFPKFLEHDLSQSLTFLLQNEYHTTIHQLEEKIEVVPARGKAAQYLKVATDFPLLRVLMHAVDAEGKTAFVSRDVYRSDHVRITVKNLIAHT